MLPSNQASRPSFQLPLVRLCSCKAEPWNQLQPFVMGVHSHWGMYAVVRNPNFPCSWVNRLEFLELLGKKLNNACSWLRIGCVSAASRIFPSFSFSFSFVQAAVPIHWSTQSPSHWWHQMTGNGTNAYTAETEWPHIQPGWDADVIETEVIS